jgi:ketosteroid isomerase-like protein
MDPAVSNANTLLVQGLYTAFGRGDIGSVLALLSEDVEWSEPENPFNPAAGTRRGHEGFLEWARIGKEAEDILALEPRRFLAHGDMVAVIGHTTCRARPTGRTYDSDFVHLVTIVDGKVTRFQEFFDTFAAAEAFRP